MNTRDSEHMIAQLKEREGYETTTDLKEADLILINTCSVREKPVQKLFSELGAFNKKKKEGAKIGVCGCTASHLGEEIIKRAPYVSFVLGARNVSKISEVLHKDKAVETDINYDESEFAFDDFRSSPYKAYINISIGCDKQCSFCIVPKTRGEEISIPDELIVNEAKKAVEKGAKEIFLLGQNVNNYGRRFSDPNHEKVNFTELLRRLSQIEGLKRIRFTSPHPFHMDDEFIEEFAHNPKICKSMHMPLQSGSTKVLKAMKRGYTKEWFLNRVEKLRKECPEVSISTDIIVAFPGESEEDFEDTLDVMRQVKFDQIFSFKYSPRPHTEAEKLPMIDDEIASARLAHLQSLQAEILDENAKKHAGQIYEVYFEELSRDNHVSGRTHTNLVVKVKGSEELLGEFKKVKITQIGRTICTGEIVA